jgi:hypothetical protein
MCRIFIAINLSEDIKNKPQAIQKKWLDLPVRFTKFVRILKKCYTGKK